MSKAYCLISGGRDSAVACHYYITNNNTEPVVVHASTPLEDPLNIEYVKKYAEFINAELIITKPRIGLEAISKWGLPGLHNRWCMRVWKQEPMRKAIPKGSTIVLGIRWRESSARTKRYKSFKFNDRYYNAVLPIADWTKQQVLQYIKENNIPANPLWNINGHSSHDCTICLVYARTKDLLWLRQHNRQIYNKLINAIKEAYKISGKYPRFLNINEKQIQAIINMDQNTY